MSQVCELRTSIRDFIRHPRRLNLLLNDKPNWNQLASSFDTIADTEMAIETYKSLPLQDDRGSLYLMIYGLLQALYVQQDAVESLVRGFRPNQTPKYEIKSEPEAQEIRSIRNKAIGHPTVQGNASSKKTPGVQTSYHISQQSMWNGGFQLMTTFASGSHTFTDVKLFDLIESNARMLERVLQTLKGELEAAEMEHRKEFRNDKLVDIFPVMLDYYFEKVFEGARKIGTGHHDWGKISLLEIDRTVKEFRKALTQRGIINRTSDYEYYLAEAEYPLGELIAYFQFGGSLKDARAADIFVDFLRGKVHGLLAMAEQLDGEYSKDVNK